MLSFSGHIFKIFFFVLKLVDKLWLPLNAFEMKREAKLIIKVEHVKGKNMWLLGTGK